jgi:hypothetical protein
VCQLCFYAPTRLTQGIADAGNYFQRATQPVFLEQAAPRHIAPQWVQLCALIVGQHPNCRTKVKSIFYAKNRKCHRLETKRRSFAQVCDLCSSNCCSTGTARANGWKQVCFTPTRPSLGVKFEKERQGEVAPRNRASPPLHQPKSTLHYRATRIANPTAHKAGRPTALTVSDEKAVDLIVQHADGLGTLTTSEVADAVAAFVSRMPEARRRSVTFLSGRPGPKFIKGFRHRHEAYNSLAFDE